MSLKKIRQAYNISAFRGQKVVWKDELYQFLYGFLAQNRQIYKNGKIIKAEELCLIIKLEDGRIIKEHPLNVKYIED